MPGCSQSRYGRGSFERPEREAGRQAAARGERGHDGAVAVQRRDVDRRHLCFGFFILERLRRFANLQDSKKNAAK